MIISIADYEHEIRVEPIGDSNNVDILPQLILIDANGNREELAINNPDCISLHELTLLTVLANILKSYKSLFRRTFQGNGPHGKDLPWSGDLNCVSSNCLRMPN